MPQFNGIIPTANNPGAHGVNPLNYALNPAVANPGPYPAPAGPSTPLGLGPTNASGGPSPLGTNRGAPSPLANVQPNTNPNAVLNLYTGQYEISPTNVYGGGNIPIYYYSPYEAGANAALKAGIGRLLGPPPAAPAQYNSIQDAYAQTQAMLEYFNRASNFDFNAIAGVLTPQEIATVNAYYNDVNNNTAYQGGGYDPEHTPFQPYPLIPTPGAQPPAIAPAPAPAPPPNPGPLGPDPSDTPSGITYPPSGPGTLPTNDTIFNQSNLTFGNGQQPQLNGIGAGPGNFPLSGPSTLGFGAPTQPLINQAKGQLSPEQLSSIYAAGGGRR